MKRIYVALDDLLDTRLGLISLLNKDLALSYLDPDNPRYFKRMHDSVIWEDLGITESDWYTMREKRTTELLKASVITHIPSVIMKTIKLYHLSGDKQIGEWDVRLDVNTHPYDLNEEELNEIKDILLEKIPLVTEIGFVKANLKGLTPNHLKTNFDYIFMYDFNIWSMLHASELRKTFMTDMHFFVPRLFTQLPTDEDFKGLDKVLEMDPFKLIEGALSYKMGITFIAASDFGPVLTKPIRRQTDHPDLDDLLDLSVLGTPESSLHDPLYPSHPESTSS